MFITLKKKRTPSVEKLAHKMSIRNEIWFMNNSAATFSTLFHKVFNKTVFIGHINIYYYNSMYPILYYY